MRAYVAKWNADPKHSTMLEGWKQARSHGICTILSYQSGPTMSQCGKFFTRTSYLLEGLRDVGYADEILTRLRHNGHYIDDHQSETYRGQVWQLPARNGREQFICGYVESESGYAVLDATNNKITIADNKEDAARWADSLAERMAEDAREYDEKYQAQQKLEDERDDLRKDLKALREECSARIAVLRSVPVEWAAERDTVCKWINKARRAFHADLQRICECTAELEGFEA
jgi:hypothetical protein